jgi:hypothetical protein
MRTRLAASAVLTLIAYRFILANLVPKLPYLTRLDYVTLGCTVLVFGTFIEVIFTILLIRRDRESLVRKIDRWCRLAFPVLLGAVIVWAVSV